MATRQSTFNPVAPQSVKATMAFTPMPDARAMGRLLTKPMMMVMMAAPKHVAVSAAVKSMPAACKNVGFTAMM